MNSEDFLQQSEGVGDLIFVEAFNQGDKVFFHRDSPFFGAGEHSFPSQFYNIVNFSDNQQFLEVLYHFVKGGKVVMPNLLRHISI